MRLSLHEYEQSKHIGASDYQFYSLIAAAMRQADTDNLEALKLAFPGIYESLTRRYSAPLGVVSEWDGMTANEHHAKLYPDLVTTECHDDAIPIQKRNGRSTLFK